MLQFKYLHYSYVVNAILSVMLQFVTKNVRHGVCVRFTYFTIQKKKKKLTFSLTR